MAARTATVSVRIEPEIKEKAEAILAELGVSASTFFNMAYRQVIAQRGVPFPMTLRRQPRARDAMTDEEFEAMIDTRIAEIDTGKTMTCDEAFRKFTKATDIVQKAE